MVIAQDTDYILLDEPLNNLDMKHSVEIMKLLKELVVLHGKTIAIVIHDINFACLNDILCRPFFDDLPVFQGDNPVGIDRGEVNIMNHDGNRFAVQNDEFLRFSIAAVQQMFQKTRRKSSSSISECSTRLINWGSATALSACRSKISRLT